jgi:hypothetical protein
MKRANKGNGEDILNGTSLQTKGTNNSSYYFNFGMYWQHFFRNIFVGKFDDMHQI